MNLNPILGVFFHWLGGLASGSFYVPYRGVKHWSWETYWLVGGFFSWIIAPWVLAGVLTHDVFGVLGEATASCLLWTYFWGAMWGLGGLTFGLTMRYLGMSLGMAVALGYCAAFGTLMPPIFHGTFITEVVEKSSGQIILFGVAVCLAGIAISGMAGMSKEREMSEEEKKEAIKEFDFKKGILVATFSGVMSACFSYGLDAGTPIKVITQAHGTSAIWQGLPVLIVILLGGFTSNFIWCVYLNMKNKTGFQYLSSMSRPGAPTKDEETIMESAFDAPSDIHSNPYASPKANLDAPPKRAEQAAEPTRVPLFSNYLFCALAGTTWYMQFFFYTMGESQMGKYGFSSWTLHMASIIIFSTLWGVVKEWKGASQKTINLVVLGLAVLVGSTCIVGYGNKIAGEEKTEKDKPKVSVIFDQNNNNLANKTSATI